LRVPFVTRVRLSSHAPDIEYETRIEPSGKHYRLRVAFPTSQRQGAIRHEIPFGIQERGPQEHLAQHWAAVTGPQAGLAVLNAGTPGNTVDAGMLMLTLFRSAAMEYKAPSVGSFQEGVPHVFRYAILPHTADDTTAIVRRGQAFNQAPLVLSAQPQWLAQHDWRLEGDANALLSSICFSNGAVFARAYESEGRESHATLRVPGRFKAWAVANGLQEAAGPFSPLEGSLPLHLGPFEIRNMVLRGD